MWFCINYLVSYPRNNFRYFGDFADDGIGGRDPGKWGGGLIVMVGEIFDLGGQFADVSERASPKSALGDEPEPALHLIEPRRIRGRVKRTKANEEPSSGDYIPSVSVHIRIKI